MEIGTTEKLLRIKDVGLTRTRMVGLRSLLVSVLLGVSALACIVGLSWAVRVYTQTPISTGKVGTIPAADGTRQPGSIGSTRTGSLPEKPAPGVNLRTTRSSTGSGKGSKPSPGSTATAAGAAPPTKPTGWSVNWEHGERWGQ